MRGRLEALKKTLTQHLELDRLRRESGSWQKMISLARDPAKECRKTAQPIEVEGFTLYGCKVYLHP